AADMLSQKSKLRLLGFAEAASQFRPKHAHLGGANAVVFHSEADPMAKIIRPQIVVEELAALKGAAVERLVRDERALPLELRPLEPHVAARVVFDVAAD